MGIWRAVAVAAAVVVAGGVGAGMPGTAQARPDPKVKIDNVNYDHYILGVVLTYTCSSGEAHSLDASVVEKEVKKGEGAPMKGAGSKKVTCDGKEHKVTVPVKANGDEGWHDSATATVRASFTGGNAKFFEVKRSVSW